MLTQRLQKHLKVYFENDSKRYYPFNVVPHILGFTGYDNNGLQELNLLSTMSLWGVTEV